MDQSGYLVTIMHRFSLVSGHEDAYLEIWKKEAKLRQRYGFNVLNAFVETGKGMRYRLKTGELLDPGNEKVFTWLYSYDGDIDDAEKRLNSDPEMATLVAEKKKHILNDESIRRVTNYIMKPATEDSIKKMVIMRRYNIINDWDEFLDIWWRIVPVREKHGFPCIFAVGDVEEKVFTWAFTYDGDDFETFMRSGQAEYYNDPQRVELETVNNYLEEIRLTPARQLIIP